MGDIICKHFILPIMLCIGQKLCISLKLILALLRKYIPWFIQKKFSLHSIWENCSDENFLHVQHNAIVGALSHFLLQFPFEQPNKTPTFFSNLLLKLLLQYIWHILYFRVASAVIAEHN
jgi:hypothetical protein